MSDLLFGTLSLLKGRGQRRLINKKEREDIVANKKSKWWRGIKKIVPTKEQQAIKTDQSGFVIAIVR
jgi:hypothetical protein